MKIEYLFPEITGIFGDHANIDILKRSVPNAEVISTSLNSEPRFISEEMDLVYMGSMTELSQKIVISKVWHYLFRHFRKVVSVIPNRHQSYLRCILSLPP